MMRRVCLILDFASCWLGPLFSADTRVFMRLCLIWLIFILFNVES